MTSLRDRTLFITGATRGIGKAIGLAAAREGANVVLIGKTEVPHPKLPGTLSSAAAEIEQAGGKALALRCDVRFEEQVSSAVDEALQRFGGIDILVNNASAISLTDMAHTSMKRFDLMHQVNVRGTFLCSKLCLAALERAPNPHILMLSPPLSFEARWYAPHLAYTLSKMGMSQCVLGLSEELRARGIAVNALWPRTVIATAAVENLLGGEAALRCSRHPSMVADAATLIFKRQSASLTGQFLIDEELLREAGVHDFSSYALDPNAQLLPDLFV